MSLGLHRLFVMVGIPGSGKSTKAKELAEQYNAKIFSSDEYRKNILGDENDQQNNAKVFDALYNDLSEAIENTNCIFDATNCSYKTRKRVLDKVKNIKCNKTAYVMTTSIADCIKRDCARERTVGTDVIMKFVYSFQLPQYFEGFDKIEFDNIDNFEDIYDPYFALDMAARMSEFDQKNPHHINDLYTHSIMLSEQFDGKDNRYLAGKWHDVGKLFTQTFDENNIAHYIGHANYSTYYLLSHPYILSVKSKQQFIDTMFYINEHMHIRDIIKSDKAINKYAKLYSKERLNKLIEFMEADNKASKLEKLD